MPVLSISRVRHVDKNSFHAGLVICQDFLFTFLWGKHSFISHFELDLSDELGSADACLYPCAFAFVYFY